MTRSRVREYFSAWAGTGTESGADAAGKMGEIGGLKVKIGKTSERKSYRMEREDEVLGDIGREQSRGG